MSPLVRNHFGSHPPPKCFPGLAVQAKHDELVGRIRVRDVEDSLGLVFRTRQGRIHFAGIDRSEKKDFVAPNKDARSGLLFI